MRLLRIVPDETKFDFMRFRRISFPLSALLSIIATLLFFFSGLNLVFMGVVGEYVGRIYHQTRFGRRVAVSRLLNFTPETSVAAASGAPKPRPLPRGGRVAI